MLWFSPLNRHCKCEYDHSRLSIEDLHTWQTQIAFAWPLLDSIVGHSCASHLAVVSVWSVCPPHPVHHSWLAFFLSYPALCGSLGCSGIVWYGCPYYWFFTRGWPIDAYCFPVMLGCFLTTLHIGALEEVICCSPYTFRMHAFGRHAMNCSGLKSKISGSSVSPDCLISVPCGVMARKCRMELAWQLRNSWRSSRLPTFQGPNHHSLP